VKPSREEGFIPRSLELRNGTLKGAKVNAMNLLATQKRKVIPLPPSKRNQGGPLEQAALNSTPQKKFKVYVRDGYVFINPHNKAQRLMGGEYDEEGNKLAPMQFDVTLPVFDYQRWKLHPVADELKEIEFERSCVQAARMRGAQDPVREGAREYAARIEAERKKWVDDKKLVSRETSMTVVGALDDGK
jgi:hypothetical protein